MCRKFLEKQGATDVYVYGETPLTTLEKIVRAFSIQPGTKWLELGSGRGRGSLWLSEFWGCWVKGVEWVPSFVSRASRITKWLPSSRAQFFLLPMQQADFSWADVVYLCGTCMSHEEITSLFEPMKALRKGSKVITVSEPLAHPRYVLLQTLEVSFPWGETEVYLHETR